MRLRAMQKALQFHVFFSFILLVSVFGRTGKKLSTHFFSIAALGACDQYGTCRELSCNVALETKSC